MNPLLAAVAACPLAAATPPADAATPAPPGRAEPAQAANAATVPVPREDPAWLARHESFNERARVGAAKGDIGVVFLGDSITQGWETQGRETWQRLYAPRGAVNFGISGDRTQHVLWRIGHGNLEGLASPAAGQPPRLVVVMIGTNNSNGRDHTAEEIAAGIGAVVGAVREKLPEAKILLLAVFPRGERPNPQRDKNARASRLASALADNETVHYLDLAPHFTNADGTISAEVMPDFLHLSPKGYEIWGEAMEPKIRELLGEPAADAAEPD